MSDEHVYTCLKCHEKEVRYDSSTIHAWICAACGTVDKEKTSHDRRHAPRSVQSKNRNP